MSATFYIGDAIETMNKLPAGSVDLILTSPPFLALRSYLPGDHPDKPKEGGSQSTPGEFIDWLIDFAEASARVLAPHGSFCVELGDTYSGSGGGGGDYYEGGLREGQPGFTGSESASRDALKDANAAHWRQKNQNVGAWPMSKSLSLIPELFRLSLVYGFNPLTGRQTERWRLRNVVRWVRPNPPVGALGDKFRPATSELMVFCKSAKRYFDLDAVREPNPRVDEAPRRGKYSDPSRGPGGDTSAGPDKVLIQNPAGSPPLDYWNIPLADDEKPTKYGPKPKPPQPPAGDQKARYPGGNPTYGPGRYGTNVLGSPPLDWWEIPPGGYEGSHYAVFPLELCVKPVKAMSPEKVCRVCGEPSRRMVDARSFADGVPTDGTYVGRRDRTDGIRVGEKIRATFSRTSTTLGWTDCGHDSWRPGLILDPFGGSGTVAAVATGHGRDCILIDLDERNFDLALGRVGPFMLTLGNIDEK